MKRDEAVRKLTSCMDDIRRQFGVRSLLIFGSTARDEATESSDVDVLVEFNRPTGYFGLISLQERLENLLGCKVDVGTPRSLKPRVRDRALQESIHVI